MIIHTWNDTYQTILISFIPFSFTCNVNPMLDPLDPHPSILPWRDIWLPLLLPLAYVVSSKPRILSWPNSHLSSINIQSTRLLSSLILQHQHTRRYGLLINRVVVIYKHNVWFTYSRSYLHTCSISWGYPTSRLCIHSCKVLSYIYRSIAFTTSPPCTSLVYHNIYWSSEVEHIICIKDTARARLLTSLFDVMPYVHTQSSQTLSSPLSGDTFLPWNSVKRTTSRLVINTAGWSLPNSANFHCNRNTSNFDYALFQQKHIVSLIVCTRHWYHTSICGSLIMFGTATNRVIHCVSYWQHEYQAFTSSEKLSICPHVKIDYCLSTADRRS